MHEVTQLLNAIEGGDPHAANELLPLVYDELRRLAAQKLAEEAPGQTLQATALVHEAYVRLVGQEDEPAWNSRGHFFAAAAEAMRRILIDNARRKRARKRGGGQGRRDIELDQLAGPQRSDDLLAVDEALEKLGRTEPRIAQLVKLRFYGGLTLEKAARALDISARSADSYWAYARAWLHAELHDVTH
jgi:RNA polymerase sigma factor (TIGR02999 family)